MSKIQSILFDKKYFNTDKARNWLKKNNFKPIKRVHITKNFLRYRILYPSKAYGFRIINFGKHIKAVVMFR